MEKTRRTEGAAYALQLDFATHQAQTKSYLFLLMLMLFTLFFYFFFLNNTFIHLLNHRPSPLTYLEPG